MRISDWSSDVCSSDLVLALEARSELPAEPSRVIQLPEPVSPFPDPGRETDQTLLYDFTTGEVETLGPSHWGGGRFSADGQIGRAAGREGVGRAVWSWWVADTLQTKKNKSKEK